MVKLASKAKLHRPAAVICKKEATRSEFKQQGLSLWQWPPAFFQNGAERSRPDHVR